MTALVSTWLEDEPIKAELLSAPNAIAVCRVRFHELEIVRHVSKIEPLNDEARALLRGGDSFVRRDTHDVIAKIGANPDAPTAALSGWTAEQMDLLRLYLVAQYQEMQRAVSKRTGNRKVKMNAQLNRCGEVLRYVKDALKAHRRKADAGKVGLTEEQMRDPNALLLRARELLWEQHRNGHLADEHRPFLNTLSNYFAHGSKVCEGE